MATKRSTTTAKKTKRSAAETASDKAFAAALTDVERLAKERIQNSLDPFSTGLKMVGQLKKLIETIESECGEDYMAATEAGGYATVGVGVGVL